MVKMREQEAQGEKSTVPSAQMRDGPGKGRCRYPNSKWEALRPTTAAPAFELDEEVHAEV